MLTDKLRKADEIIEALENETMSMKREISRLERNQASEKQNPDRSYDSYQGNSHQANSRNNNQRNSYNSVPDVVGRSEVNRLESQVSSLKAELNDKQRVIRDLQEEISHRPSKEVIREVIKEVPVYKRSDSISAASTEEEKNHVIKVLEHESKVYNFEKTVLGAISTPNLAMGGFKPRGSYHTAPGQHF